MIDRLLRRPGGQVDASRRPLKVLDNRQLMELFEKDLASAAMGAGWVSWGGGRTGYRTGPARLSQLAAAYGGTNDSDVWVFACVSWIAPTMGSYPWRFVDARGDTIESPPGDLAALLERPNPRWTYFDLTEAVMTDLELVGNAYVLKNERSALGRPKSLFRLDPARVRIAVAADGSIVGYVFTPREGSMVPYDAAEIMHFRYPNPLDEHYGMGTVEAIAVNIDRHSAEGLHLLGFFENGARISGVLTVPETMTDTQFERLKQSYAGEYAGPANAYKLLVAEGATDYKAITVGPAAAGVLDLMKLSKDEICSAFGLPAVLLGGNLENANYKMAEAQTIALRAMIPRARRFAERVTLDLAALWGVEFRVDPHANEPLEVRIARAKEMVGSGATLNEGREVMGLEPSDDPLADVILVPNTMIPLPLVGAPPRPGRSIPMGETGEPGAPNAAPAANGAAPAPELAERLADLPAQVTAPKMLLAELKAAGDGDGLNEGVMVALYPPPALAADLALTDGDPPEQLHVTLAFLGDAADLDDADALRSAVEAWAGETVPLEGEISGVGLFTAADLPVTYLSVDLPALPAARQHLVEALADAGAPASATHGFSPHLTLAYADRLADVDLDVGGTPLSFDSVAVVVGEDRVDYPLLGEPEKALTRAQIKAAVREALAELHAPLVSTVSGPAVATTAPVAAGRSALAATAGACSAWGSRSGPAAARRKATEGEVEWSPPELPAGFEQWKATATLSGVARLTLEHQARVLRAGVAIFTPALRGFFKGEEGRVMAALGGFSQGGRSARVRGKAKSDLTVEGIFDLAAENEWLRAAYLAAVDQVGVVAADTPEGLVAGVSWDLSDPNIERLRSSLAAKVTRVNDVTRGQIAEVVTEGLRRSYSVTQISNGYPPDNFPGVAGVFDASTLRAETIARTESGFAFNGSQALSYRDAGVGSVEILDGEGDAECAAVAGTVQTLEWYELNPLGHPNCVRCAVPADGAAAEEG